MIISTKLFAICYKEEQFSEISPPFEPWDNLANINSELREFPVFEKAFSSPVTQNLDYYGLLSPKFEQKSHVSGKQFLEWINASYQKQPSDVYFINPVPIVEAIFPNVNQHGENCHPGLSRLLSRHIPELKNLDILSLHMDVRTFAMCNYFVGNKKFWSLYIQFVNSFLESVKTNPDDILMLYKQGANYGPNQSLPYYSFAVERLFSIFLNIQLVKKEITFTHFPYSYEMLKQKTNLPDNILEELVALSDMKQVAISGGYMQMMKHWAFFRNRFVQQNPYLFYME